MALENGGDDFITKPFHPEIVIAKIRSQLRRAYGEYAVQVEERVLELEGLQLYPERLKLTVKDKAVPLSKREADLIESLIERYPRVAGREDLLEKLWDDQMYVDENTLNVNITHEIMKFYGPILFVGLFIGVVFFVSAGSFLYFRLYMDLDEDKQKFSSIAKMGLTVKELKKVLTRQTAILFFAPIIVALIHGAVALTALSNLFEFNIFKESVMVLGVFLIIQIIYFFIVRFFYTKQIQAVI